MTADRALLAAALAAVLAAPNSARAAWTDPQPAPDGADARPWVVAGASGGAVAWTSFEPPRAFRSGLALAEPDGATRTLRVPAHLRLTGQPVLRRGSLVAIGIRGAGPGSRPVLASGDLVSGVRATRSLGPASGARPGRRGELEALSVHLSASGPVVVALRCENRSCSRRSLILQFRDAGGALARSVTVAAGSGLRAISTALNGRRDVLAVWQRGRAVLARRCSQRGCAAAAQRLGRAAPDGARTAAALARDGRAVAAWASQAVDEGDATSDFLARAAFAPPGRGFGRRRLLERVPPLRGGSNSYVRLAGMAVALGRSGRDFVLAWTGADDGTPVVRSGTFESHGLRQPRTLSAPGEAGELAAVAGDSGGNVMVLWIGTDATDGRAGPFAATDRGAGFGAAERIAAPSYAPTELAGAIAGDVAVAAWRNVGAPFEFALRR